jgi:hypothetical protein
VLVFEGKGFPAAAQEELKRFSAELEQHAQGGAVEARLIVAESQPGGITSTMRETLRAYMKADEFARWNETQEGRTVATAGKTFMADDEVVTAVLLPMPDMAQELLDLAAHEIIEMARLGPKDGSAWRPDDPDEADGLVLFDEYRNERVRQEIRQRLGWPEGQLDAVLGVAGMAEEIAARMPPNRLDPPPIEFYGAWLEMAQVWSMASGRADAGSESAMADLAHWADTSLVAYQGWQPVAEVVRDLYGQPWLDAGTLAPILAERVRRPVLEYGRTAWRKGP